MVFIIHLKIGLRFAQLIYALTALLYILIRIFENYFQEFLLKIKQIESFEYFLCFSLHFNHVELILYSLYFRTHTYNTSAETQKNGSSKQLLI